MGLGKQGIVCEFLNHIAAETLETGCHIKHAGAEEDIGQNGTDFGEYRSLPIGIGDGTAINEPTAKGAVVAFV
jgi:hypothetical protein